MLVRVSTRLPAPADLVWDTVKRTDTLRYVTRGLLGFRPEGELPERFAEGETYRMRLLFFGVLPAWRHEIRIAGVDDAGREIRTEEHGGPIRSWQHRIAVDDEGWGSTRYLDEIQVAAGVLTPLVWFYTQLFYRYRQRRWRRLARSLGAADQPSGSA